MHVVSMEIVLMEGATAFLDFTVMIAIDVSSHILQYILTSDFRVHFASVFEHIIAFIFPLTSACSLNLFQVPAPAIALEMACVSTMEYVNVNLATLALTVPLVKFNSRLCIP